MIFKEGPQPSKKPIPGPFQVICAWCGKVENRPPARPPARDVAPAPALPVSHTICDTCFVKERANMERVVKARRKRSSA